MGLKNRSSVTIHVGQCGAQCAPAIWNMLQKEHNLDLYGKDSFNKPGADPHTMFREHSSGNFIPRALIIDLDPSTIDALKSSANKNLFNSNLYISGSEDGASCYARARYVQGYEIISPARNALRQQMEACNKCVSVVHNCATSGGTGSGIVPDILTAEESTRSYTSIGVEVYCSPGSDNALGYYNTVLHMNAMNDLVDVNVVLDNDALFRIAASRYNPKSPYLTFAQVNQGIAATYSTLTAGERFQSENLDIWRFKTCLVPYQGLSYITSTVSSFQEPQNRTIPVMNLMEDAFGDLASCSMKRDKGQYFGSYIIVRGDCRVSFDSLTKIKEMCDQKRFAPWIPCKFTFGHCHTSLPSDMNPFFMANQSITHFYNHSDITSIFDDYARWFGVSYSKKSFWHWYQDNGMQEREFNEALESLAILQRVYKSIGRMSETKGDFQNE